jgi:hypothetical protein
VNECLQVRGYYLNGISLLGVDVTYAFNHEHNIMLFNEARASRHIFLIHKKNFRSQQVKLTKALHPPRCCRLVRRNHMRTPTRATNTVSKLPVACHPNDFIEDQACSSANLSVASH